MKRRLVKQGISTMMVSLPSKWVRENGLGKGDEVDIEPLEGKLLVSSEGKGKKAETEITLTGLIESSIGTRIANAYREGYDKIKVSFSSETQFRILQNLIRKRLIGFDVIKKEKDYCIIENITEPSVEQFENILQKIFYGIAELFEITAQKLENKKPVSDYEDIDARLQQYDNFCRRVITKKHEKDATLFWAFLALIRYSQRELYHLDQFLDKNKVKAPKELLELLDEGRKIFDLVREAYSKKDTELLEKVHELEKIAIYKKAYKIMNSVPAYRIASCIRSLYLATSPLMGLLLSA